MNASSTKSRPSLNLRSALQSARELPKEANSTFLRLVEGQSVEVVFAGDVLALEGTWRDKKFVPWRPEYVSEGLRRSFRYAMVVILLEEKRGVVIEVNRPTFLEWGEDLPENVEELVVRLKRFGGRGDPKSRIAARAVRPLKGSESDELDAVARPNLEKVFAEFFAEEET